MRYRSVALFLFSTAAFAGPALAGPRDDMTAGIARCGAIADDRVYLECVYGAAQPLRAQLGLPPAPAAQTRLVPAISALPQQAALQPPPPPPPLAKKEGWLGGLFDGPRAALYIVFYSFDQHGMFTVTLSDGEILRQADNDVHYAHWKGSPPREGVRLIASSLGNEVMEVGGEQDAYMVQRVR